MCRCLQTSIRHASIRKIEHSAEEDMNNSAEDETRCGPNTFNSTKSIGILGTGDYACAMAKRLVFSGYDVVMGSRSPADRHNINRRGLAECLYDVEMTSVEDCINRNDVLVAAIHAENFRATFAARAASFSGKVVIDVSNRTNSDSTVSNAEFLQTLIPGAAVVKAFNTVSAYSMDDTNSAKAHRVLVSSDHVSARECVKNLARDLGCVPIDMGSLKASRAIELSVLTLFPGWKGPLIFTFGVFVLWMPYCLYLHFTQTTVHSWDQMFLKVTNEPISVTAVTVLSVTYLAGSVAGIVQLYRGTKYIRFPEWLNVWLTARRHLGLIALTLVIVHALASSMMLSPTYYASWFLQPGLVIVENFTQQTTVLHLQPAWMVWEGELSCLLGLVALLLLCIIGVTSLPTVSASLNWAEWRLVQSRLGFLALMLVLCHVLAMGLPEWLKMGWPDAFCTVTFLSAVLPAITLMLRLLLCLPLVSGYLERIRRGWERGGRGMEDEDAEEALSFEVHPEGKKQHPRKSVLKNVDFSVRTGIGSRFPSPTAGMSDTAALVNKDKYHCYCLVADHQCLPTTEPPLPAPDFPVM